MNTTGTTPASDSAATPPTGRGNTELNAIDQGHSPEQQTLNKLTLTVSEAAVALGISRALAYELVARDEIPAIRLGHRIVVPTQRLLDLVFDR